MSIVKYLRAKIEQIVLAALLLIAGILLCMSISPVTLGVIVGIMLIVYGAFTIQFLILKKRSIASKDGYLSCILIAVGIALITENLFSVFVYMLPYVLVVMGAVLFVDAFLARFQRKDANAVLFAIKLVLGIALVAFSICLLTIDRLSTIIPIAFGVMLILASIAIIGNLFASKKVEKRLTA